MFSINWIKTARSTWKVDVIAGLSVAVVTIPQSLAYASLVGVPLQYGLYAAALPTIVAGIFSSSRVLSTGPVAVISLLTAATVSLAAQPNTPEFLSLVVKLSLLVSLFQLIFATFKLASLINFIALPVVVAFTSAAALVITISQLPNLLGIDSADHSYFYQHFYHLIQQINHADPATTWVGILSVIGILFLKKTLPKFPTVLFIAACCTLISWMTGYTGKIIGEIPLDLPKFQLSLPSYNEFNLLFSTALIIAVISYMEGFSVAKRLSKQAPSLIIPNQEMFSLAMANFAAHISGTFPVAGSVTRSALNTSAGAKSNLSSIITGLASIAALIALTPLLHHLPLATLSAIIITAVYQLIDTKQLKYLVSTRKRDGIVALSTFIACLYFAPHLDKGIIVGFIMSVFMHLHRSIHPHLEIFDCHDIAYLKQHQYNLKHHPSNKHVMAVSFDWSLTFANSSYLYEQIINHINLHHPKPKYVLLLCRSINHIDASAQEVIEQLNEELASQGIVLVFSGLKDYVIDKMKRTHLYDQIGSDHIFPKANDALANISKLSK